MAISGGSTTLAELVGKVNDHLGNYEKFAAADAVGDGIATVFELPHVNIVSGSVNVTVGGASADYTLDYDTGVVTFDVAPALDAAIHVSYEYIPWNEDEVISAVNEGLLEAWAEFHDNIADITSITPDGETTEFSLPADCAYLYRVEFRSTDDDPPKRVRQWSVSERDDFTQYVILYQPEATGTYILHYVKSLIELVADDDTIEENGVPTHAKYGVVHVAAAVLLSHALGRRIRSNQFFNVEGSNVPKIYEMQRVMADYRALAEMAFKKARRSPRINTS